MIYRPKTLVADGHTYTHTHTYIHTHTGTRVLIESRSSFTGRDKRNGVYIKFIFGKVKGNMKLISGLNIGILMSGR